LPEETPEMSCDRDLLESTSMKEIPLTQGKVAIVDDGAFAELSKYRWYAHKICNTWYAERNSLCVNGKRHKIRMHAAIVGTPKGMGTDHVNGNGLDNRRENLRIVTKRQNGQNLHIQKTSRFPGVSWHKRDKKWEAEIKIAGKTHYLGIYDSEEAAARRYQIACDWQVAEMEVFA
jgi:hypothetical protein